MARYGEDYYEPHARARGACARRTGKGRDANPHVEHTWERKSWDMGWSEADLREPYTDRQTWKEATR